MTTNTSMGEAMQYIKHQGGYPTMGIIGFDREERDTEGTVSAVKSFTQKYGIPIFSAAKLSDLISVLEEDTEHKIPLGEETLPLILKYREEYGMK